MHEPIISQALFYKVQNIINKKGSSKHSKHEYLFKGLIYCYHCKRRLQICLDKKSVNPYIHCIDYRKINCYSQSMNYNRFENKMIEIIKGLAIRFSNQKQFNEVYVNYIKQEKLQISSYNKKISDFNNRIKDVDEKIETLYLDKLNKVIDENTYIKIANKFIDEKNTLKQEIMKLEDLIKNALDNSDNIINENNLNEAINEFLNSYIITKNIIYKLINKIEIDKDKNIFINFNFKSLNILNNSEITETYKTKSL
ncbi:MAG: zinc ribbon domain-containing protein [Firmicutes bacterium]|nr:zinc ribbon domain-containing protein [Bacillota bacterium]